MSDQLPLFEGSTPDKAAVRLSGSVDFDRDLATAHHLDQTVFLIVEATVGSITHQRDADGELHRVHALKTESLAVLPAAEGAQLLIKAHKAIREAAGIHELPLDDDGWQDEGVRDTADISGVG